MSVISLDEWRKKQAVISNLKSPLPQNIPWEKLGVKRTDELDPRTANIFALFIVLDRAWRKPFSIKSNFARQGAMHVAIAASEAFITTNMGDDTWGNYWCITELGMTVKEELNAVVREVIEDVTTEDE